MAFLTWLKKHWKWLLFPVGVLLWFLGRAGQRKVVVASPELVKHFEERQRIDAEADKQIKAAAVVKNEALAKTEAEFTRSVQAVEVRAVERAEAVQGKPEAVNDLLLKVGQSVRKNPLPPRPR
jgi:hypothetical protein